MLPLLSPASGPRFTGPGVSALLLLLSLLFFGCRKEDSHSPQAIPHADPGFVTVYSSIDDAQARPIADAFKTQTGIEVRLVSDTEETKSSGLLNRLIAESARPRADVFWSGDIARAAVLKSRGLSMAYSPNQAEGLPKQFSDPEHHFTGFAARLRVILYNRRLVGNAPPTSVLDLAHPRFKSKACIANPLFGTTAMHAAALFHHLGQDYAQAYFRAFTTNQVRMLSSNGEVRRRVAAGDYAIGLTDSDDVSVALRDGADVGFVIPDQHQDGMGAVMIPSAVVLIQGAPNPELGRKFMDFVSSQTVEAMLATSEAAFLPLREGLALPPMFGISKSQLRTMNLDLQQLASDMESLSSGFLLEWVAAQSRAGQGR